MSHCAAKSVIERLMSGVSTLTPGRTSCTYAIPASDSASVGVSACATAAGTSLAAAETASAIAPADADAVDGLQRRRHRQPE